MYSTNDIAANGYEAYMIQSTSTGKFKSSAMKQAIQNATAKTYTQKSSDGSMGQTSSSKGKSGGSSSSSSKGKSSGSSSSSKGKSSGSSAMEPAGYYENGETYYYSQSEQKYYYIGADGKRHSC